jgi:uncharacterized membrane protein YdbT with pleckstrin-like domain
MPYPKRLLQDDEVVHADLRPHWWFFAKQIGTGLPLFVIAVLLLVSGPDGDVGKWLWILWGVVALVWAIWLGIKFLDWNFTYFVVTNERVIYRTGVIAKKGVEMQHGRINNINFSQSAWERIIGAGDLDIESAGAEGRSTFEDVKHPDGVARLIGLQMEEYDRRRASWAAPTINQPVNEPSIAGQIEDLARLRDAGHLTPEEFEAKKAELLKRM